MMKSLVLIAVTSIILLFSGCGSDVGPSAVGMYAPKPIKQKIAGSKEQATKSRTLEFSSEDMYEAAKTALLRLGYQMDVKDEKNLMIAASGAYECGASAGPTYVTIAIYLKEQNTKPETTITVMIDRQTWIGWDGGCPDRAANTLLSEIQKVLSTY